MTKEEIQKKAEELFQIVGPDFGVTDTMHGHLDYGKRQWAEGAEWAAGECEKDKWISVEDRLPGESGRYWCYVEEINDLGISHFQWNVCYSKEDNIWSDNHKAMTVTHWQPLPEKPKTDKP